MGIYIHTENIYRIIPDNGTTSISSGAASSGSVALKDVNNVTLGSIDVGVTAVAGGNLLSATALSNGSITINHDTSTLAAGSYGATASSSTSILVPRYTVDAYGHVTANTSYTATLDKVTVANRL